MIITDINPQKKKGRYNLFVDGEFYSGIGEESLIKNSLKVGKEVVKEELDLAIIDSETRDAFEKLINLVSRQMQTKFEIKQKLLKYGYSENVIKLAIKKAEEYRYVDDELYAKLFVDSKKNKSKLEIKSQLFKKGIDKNIIDEKTEVINEEQEKNRVALLAEKYMKNKEVNQKTLGGLYGYLSRKGFSLEIVNSILRKYKFEEFGG